MRRTNSIIITWQISFDHIRHVRPSAADLLSLMSFFDRQGISEALLQSRNGQSDVRETHSGDVADVNSDVDEDKDDDDDEDGDQSDSSTDCEGRDEDEDYVSTL